MGFLIGLFLFVLVLAISWSITCGIIFLITLCFGLKFSWAIATGIWLVMVLLCQIFGGKK